MKDELLVTLIPVSAAIAVQLFNSNNEVFEISYEKHDIVDSLVLDVCSITTDNEYAIFIGGVTIVEPSEKSEENRFATDDINELLSERHPDYQSSNEVLFADDLQRVVDREMTIDEFDEYFKNYESHYSGGLVKKINSLTQDEIITLLVHSLERTLLLEMIEYEDEKFGRDTSL